MMSVYSWKISCIWRDTSLYTSIRPWMKMSWGHSLLAFCDDMAERTPNFRAS